MDFRCLLAGVLCLPVAVLTGCTAASQDAPPPQVAVPPEADASQPQTDAPPSDASPPGIPDAATAKIGRAHV